MKIDEFIISQGDITIIGEDDMFNNANNMLSSHVSSGEKKIDVEKLLNIEKDNSMLGTFTYDTALLALAEILANILIYNKVFYYGKETETYITSEDLFFDENGIKYLLNELIILRNAPANEREIYDEYTAGEEEKDSYLLEIIDMYINYLKKQLN